MSKTLVSEREIPLVYQPYQHPPLQRREMLPVVTVENYCKWYRLYVVFADDSISEYPFPEFPEGTNLGSSAYVDHAPNPRCVREWAASRGYIVDENSLDMIWGRWCREALNEDVEDL